MYIFWLKLLYFWNLYYQYNCLARHCQSFDYICKTFQYNYNVTLVTQECSVSLSYISSILLFDFLVLLWSGYSSCPIQISSLSMDACTSSCWLWTARCAWIFYISHWCSSSSFWRSNTNCNTPRTLHVYHRSNFCWTTTIWLNLSNLWVSLD